MSFQREELDHSLYMIDIYISNKKYGGVTTTRDKRKSLLNSGK